MVETVCCCLKTTRNVRNIIWWLPTVAVGVVGSILCTKFLPFLPSLGRVGPKYDLRWEPVDLMGICPYNAQEYHQATDLVFWGVFWPFSHTLALVWHHLGLSHIITTHKVNRNWLPCTGVWQYFHTQSTHIVQYSVPCFVQNCTQFITLFKLFYPMATLCTYVDLSVRSTLGPRPFFDFVAEPCGVKSLAHAAHHIHNIVLILWGWNVAGILVVCSLLSAIIAWWPLCPPARGVVTLVYII